MKAAIAACVLLLAGPVFAQKARPSRLEVKPDVSTTVEGRLRGRQEMYYEVAARGRQTLTLRLASTPPRGLLLKVFDPSGTELALTHPAARQWRAVLPKNGDYTIAVIRVSRREGTSVYKLTVALR